MPKQEELIKRLNKILVENPMNMAEVGLATGIDSRTMTRFMTGKAVFLKTMLIIEKYINDKEQQ